LSGCNTEAGAGKGRKRMPSNWYAPIERDPTRRYPSAVCEIHSGPFGSIPSWTRHALCRYCVTRLLGSSASPFRATSPRNKSEKHLETARGILIAFVGPGTLYDCIESSSIRLFLETTGPFSASNRASNAQMVTVPVPPPPQISNLAPTSAIKRGNTISATRPETRRLLNRSRRHGTVHLPTSE